MTVNDFARALASVRTNACVQLDLSHQTLDSAQAVQLAEVLEANTSLKALDVSHNRIGYRGMQALAGSLRRNKTLKEVSIAANGLSHKDLITLRDLWRLRDVRLKAMAAQIDDELRQQAEVDLGRWMLDNRGAWLKSHGGNDDEAFLSAKYRELYQYPPTQALLAADKFAGVDEVEAVIGAPVSVAVAEPTLLTEADDTDDESDVDAMTPLLTVKPYQHIHDLIATLVGECDELREGALVKFKGSLLLRKQAKINALSFVLERAQEVGSLGQTIDDVKVHPTHYAALFEGFWGSRVLSGALRSEAALTAELEADGAELPTP